MENQIDEDVLCVETFLKGADRGFEDLVRRYENRVLNIIYSLIRSDSESRDIAQEVFLKVYHNLESFRRQSRFSTWLYRITVNTVYDFLRKRKNITQDAVFFEPLAASDQGPREVLLAKEKGEIVRLALAKVPFKFRSALVLKDIENLSYLEISEVLHCSLGTVESKIYRARKFLKQELLKLGVNQS